MNDTCSDIALRYRRLIMKKSNQERLMIASSMFDMTKKIVKSSIINQNSQILQCELKKEIFLRFYGLEFNSGQKKKILNFLEK